MYKKLLFIILFVLLNFSAYGSDGVEFVEHQQFNRIVQKDYPLNGFSWIIPHSLDFKIPKAYEWVKEGSAVFMTGPCSPSIEGLATADIRTCTGITAFTKHGYLALAHITDLTHPKCVIDFFKQINVNDKAPVTIIGRTLNCNHLIPVKEMIEAYYENIVPYIITLPIYKTKHKTYTFLQKHDYKSFIDAGVGVSFSINRHGYHDFFYLEPEDSEYVNLREEEQYSSKSNTYKDEDEGNSLNVHQLSHQEKNVGPL